MLRVRLAVVGAFVMGVGCVAGGCQSAWEQYYVGAVYAPSDQVEVLRDSPPEGATITRIGEAHLTSGSENKSEAIAWAKKIGANAVFLNSTYAGNVSGAVPITQYHAGGVSQTQGNFSGNVYSRSTATPYSGSYSATTYNPDYTTMTMIPFSAPRYNFDAIYFRDTAKPGLVNSPDAKLRSIP